MLVIQERFRCKPGKAKELAEKFKKSNELMEKATGRTMGRVLVDVVSDYWTVVLEHEAEDLAALEAEMNERVEIEGMEEVMAGYMDLVEGGGREIFRIA